MRIGQNYIGKKIIHTFCKIEGKKIAFEIFWSSQQKENAEAAAEKKTKEVVIVDKVDSQEIEEMSEAFKKVKKVIGQFMPTNPNLLGIILLTGFNIQFQNYATLFSQFFWPIMSSFTIASFILVH